MPRRIASKSIGQDVLAKLQQRGCDSVVLDARLRFTELDGLRKDLEKMKGDRVYPEMLPTQASGRWSTKHPNLPGFTREFWTEHKEIIGPDEGWWWLEWDWSGIEARMFTGYSGDEEDAGLFRRDADIHTFTAAKYLLESDPDGDWHRDTWRLPEDWQGKKDARRVLAKNFRYGCLQYGEGAKAALTIPNIQKDLGVDRSVIVTRAQRFLKARPKAMRWKHEVWTLAEQQRETRTFMGRRRVLFGHAKDVRKAGLNHIIQGSVADLMAWSLGYIEEHYPESHLVLNKHDGAIVAFPNEDDMTVVQQTLIPVIEQKWEIGPGITMNFPAEWQTWQN